MSVTKNKLFFSIKCAANGPKPLSVLLFILINIYHEKSAHEGKSCFWKFIHLWRLFFYRRNTETTSGKKPKKIHNPTFLSLAKTILSHILGKRKVGPKICEKEKNSQDVAKRANLWYIFTIGSQEVDRSFFANYAALFFAVVVYTT